MYQKSLESRSLKTGPGVVVESQCKKYYELISYELFFLIVLFRSLYKHKTSSCVYHITRTYCIHISLDF